MSWLAAVDNYCERLDPSFLAEPVNAVTNASFLLAAFLLWRTYRARGARDNATRTMIGLLAKVGIGSLLFHTFANYWSMWADIVPIAAFVFAYLWLAMRRFLGWSKSQSLLAFGLFIAVHFALPLVPAGWRFNGSVAYFPCFAALLAMGAWLMRQKHPAGGSLVACAMLFALSLTFRSLDMAACEALPLGTHFMWHVLNGLLLYRLVYLLLPRRELT